MEIFAIWCLILSASGFYSAKEIKKLFLANKLSNLKYFLKDSIQIFAKFTFNFLFAIININAEIFKWMKLYNLPALMIHHAMLGDDNNKTRKMIIFLEF
ncbi:hypothetical protein BpHYR1_014951 [Brachionus plicatilis]|uniref:Uncharacterized protein n=1 Tax=Brachionus plicatilis TaxID=10195 RepID=A0A3M7PZY2_BRAPC|nr:hypothetical protein BpHYR1_014951 [Brachionus plicatilis]